MQRVTLITGANTGIGRATAEALARKGDHVFVACRSIERSRPVVEAMRAGTANPHIELLELDLGDLDSVRACAEQFLARKLPLHLLIDNAGLAGARGTTRSGFEVAFGVNHVGHFLLTRLLEPCIVRSAPARIVVVASKSHYDAKGIDYDAVRRPTQTLTGMREYEVSKLANVLFATELGRRLQGTGVTTYSLHPGVVASDIWRKVPGPVRALMKRRMLTVEEGAQTTLHCATSKEAGNETGLYYDKCRPRPASRVAQDPALARELWERSEAWVGCGAQR